LSGYSDPGKGRKFLGHPLECCKVWNLPDSDPQGDQKPLTAAELGLALGNFRDDILREVKEIATKAATDAVDAQPPTGSSDTAWRIIWLVPRIFASGVFFIGLGALLLYIAYGTLGLAHSAFTFVLVVLGVAIVLYGTGTQGMGNLQSTTNAARYNIAIAGGAGVLAFCVAYGIIAEQEKIKSAFQVEKRYVRVPVMSRDGSSLLDFYLWEFSIDGVGVPALRQGKYLEILVPYFATEFTAPANTASISAIVPKSTAIPKASAPCLDSVDTSGRAYFTRTIRASYQLKEEKINENSVLSASLKPSDEEDYSIDIIRFPEPDAGYELPKYPWYLCIDVKSPQRARLDSGIAAARILPKAEEAQQQAAPKAPAIIPTGGGE
jgi:hypothetical protein